MTSGLICPRCNGRLVRERIAQDEGVLTLTRCSSCGDESRDSFVERRSSRRYAIDMPVHVVYQGNQTEAMGINISTSGISVWLPTANFAEGQAVYLKIPCYQGSIRLAGQVVWHRQSDFGNSASRDMEREVSGDGHQERNEPESLMGVEVGIAFDARRLSAQDMAALETLIQSADIAG